VGGYDFGLKKDVTTYNIVYGIAAKTFGKLGRISLGGYKGAVGADAGKVLYVASKGVDSAGNPVQISSAGVLASWDRTISEISDKLWAAVDYQSGTSGYGAANVGVAWSFSSNVSTIIGYDFYLDQSFLKPTFTVQFDINLF